MFNGKEEETPAGMAEREEREIREMQLRMAQLKKRVRNCYTGHKFVVCSYSSRRCRRRH